MFQTGDAVLYGMNGVCRISDVSSQSFGGVSAEYYVLHPINNEAATVFVPTGSDGLVRKMRPVLTREQICELIRSMPEETPIWVENENQRRMVYREILENGDRTAIVRVLKTLHQHREEQVSRGKKLRMTDERVFRDAERLLYDEFAFVLAIGRDEVPSFIDREIAAAAS